MGRRNEVALVFAQALAQARRCRAALVLDDEKMRSESGFAAGVPGENRRVFGRDACSARLRPDTSLSNSKDTGS